MSLPTFYSTSSNIGNIKPVNYVLVTGPAGLAVSLDSVKTHLKIIGTDEDVELTDIITSATTFGEKVTGRDFINKTYATYLDCFPIGSVNGVTIQKSKLQSVTSIEYYTAGVLTTYNSVNYYFTEDSEYSSIYLLESKSWPSIDNRRQAIKFTFVSGYGATETDVPEIIKRALLAHITDLYENKGDCSDCDGESISKQAEALYKPCIVSTNRFRII